MLVGTALLLCTACQQKTIAPDPPAVRIQAISAAAPEKYKDLKSMKDWKNPYLLLHTDRVGLWDANDNVEVLLKPEELAQALADLPVPEWPYGRVAAVRELKEPAAENDKVAYRRNRGLIAGTLDELHIVIRWVPAQ